MKRFSRFFNWLIRSIHLQLFVISASMPILMYWGLPISAMTLISNLIFTPCLMAFLLIASLIFFTELLCIPNQWLITILELITRCWEAILQQGSSAWLISFTKPSRIISLLIIIGAFGIVHAKKLRNKVHNILGLILLLAVTYCYLTFSTSNPTTSLILECNGGFITIVRANKQMIVIDPGVIGQRASTENWLEYTLLAELNKHFGTSTIDHLIILQPSSFVFEHIAHFCYCTKIKKIYLTLWHDQAVQRDKKLLRAYGRFRASLEATGTILQRIGHHEESLFLGKSGYLSIKPLSTRLSYKEIFFPAIHITGSINEQSISIHSKKYKNVDKQKPTV